VILLSQIFRFFISIAEGFAFFALLSYVQARFGFLTKRQYTSDASITGKKINFLDNNVRLNKYTISDNKWFFFLILKIILSCLPGFITYNASLSGLNSSEVIMFNIIRDFLDFLGVAYCVLRLVSYLRIWAKEYRGKKVKLFSRDFYLKYTGLFLVIALAITAGIGGIALVLKKAFPEKQLNTAIYRNPNEARFHLISSEASLIKLDIAKIVANYTSFGDNGGEITLANNAIIFDPMTNATGLGNYSPTGPGRATVDDKSRKLTLPVGVHFYRGSFGPGVSRNYCIVISSGSVYVKYTNMSKIYLNQSAEPLDCVNGN